MLSNKAQILKPSPTLALAARAKELKDQGHDVVSLTVGEPDWATFPKAAEAGIQAIQNGKTKYTPASGTPELKKAVLEEVKKTLGLEYTAKQVVISAGAKFVIYAALEMAVNPGDEVIIPAPYWVSYPTMVELVGAKPVMVACGKESNFKLTPELLKQSLTQHTRAIILCSPSNPTGIAYTEKELKALGDILENHPGVLVISDDIYNRLYFSADVAPHILKTNPKLKDRTLLVNGASKSFSMTGWRLGWALGPDKLIAAIADYSSQTTSNPASMSQAAAEAAIKFCDDDVKNSVAELKARKEWCLDQMSQLKYFKVTPPDGAFYFWVGIEGMLGKTFRGQKVTSDKVLAQLLIDHFHVVTVPGEEFGLSGYFRMSIAASKADLQKAVERFKQLEAELS